ncbi:hypothetical protein BDW62DRAFT_102420 [Aspergillus aurantiobrunneus]
MAGFTSRSKSHNLVGTPSGQRTPDVDKFQALSSLPMTPRLAIHFRASLRPQHQVR